MSELTILLIDDEEVQLASLKSFLSRRNYNVLTAANGRIGLDLVKENAVDLILTDFRMPEMNGKEVLDEVKRINPEIDVVVMTAFGKLEEAIGIMKSGAYDYLAKPIDLDELENLIKRVSEKKILQNENKLLREQLHEKFKFESIIPQSGKMEDVLNLAGRVAKSKATVLIRGESGTGKELIAKAVHFASNRSEKPFVTVNVAALSESLLESELFGHEKGAYTGAVGSRVGRFEEADGGTLFIDEVGEIPLNVQVKLLRALQFGEIQRLGGNETKKVSVRIIAATHRNLEKMMENNEFREDLYYRLNVVSLFVTPLRERKDDIPFLLDYFLTDISIDMGKEKPKIEADAAEFFLNYSWPGNVRELKNVVQRLLFSGENIITLDVAERSTGLTSTVHDSNEFDSISFPNPDEIISLKDMERL
ncbi:MAG: sigma-54-dependent Fis family transcriptional regulator, partial [Melioribacteraceae bacterium]|nr:sigma-54-dependent Fis family transcriptional regulator [Melioribacteraceae bacterium]